jgi:hypothetical protein
MPRFRRALTYACRVAGPLLFALWLVVYVSVQFSGTVGTSGTPLPDSGDIYLTPSIKADTSCTVQPDHGVPQTIVVRDRATFWSWGAVVGVRVDRWFSGPGQVACDKAGAVKLGSGPIAVLYPIGVTWVAPALAVLLVLIGWRDRYLPHRRPRLTRAGHPGGSKEN